MTDFQMKGFNLSTDYKKLFELIQQGYRIPAWVATAINEDDVPIVNLVEVKLSFFKQKYMIGTSGISYDSYDSTFEQFEKDCTKYSLKYIEPPQP